MVRNGKFSDGWKVKEFSREREKEWSEYVMFLSPQSHDLLTITKPLDSQSTLGSKSKVQA